MYETSTSILLPKPQRNPQSEDSGSDTSTQIYTAILAIAPRDLISRKRIYLAQTATVSICDQEQSTFLSKLNCLAPEPSSWNELRRENDFEASAASGVTAGLWESGADRAPPCGGLP